MIIRNFSSKTIYIFELCTVSIFLLCWSLNLNVLVVLGSSVSPKFHIDAQPEGILNSFKNLTEWALKEENIYKLVKLRFERLKKELRILENYIEDYAETTEKAVTFAVKADKTPEERAQLVASSGITSYRMIYRYAKHLDDLKKLFSEYDHELEDMLLEPVIVEPAEAEVNSGHGSDDNDDNSYKNLRKSKKWPSSVDINHAMQSLLHVHEIHNFHLDDIESILSFETYHPTELNAFHCAQIGMYALFKNYFALSVQWLEFSMKKITSDGDESISLIVVENYLALSVKSHNEALSRLPEYDYSVFTTEVIAGEDHDREKRQTLQYDYFNGMKENNYVEINFWGLCVGDILQTEQEKSKLFCWYEKKSNPAWYINPLKIERLSEEPPVLLIKDVLGDKMIQSIINKSEKHLARSGVIGEVDNYKLTKTRTSVNAWMEDDKMPNLIRKMELITGLKILGDDASEQLQFVEYVFGRLYPQYVFGRFYSPHTDPLESVNAKPEDKVEFRKGDRVATILFYLNDVVAGGFTPFCNAGTFNEPVKGSAIFWYNMYRNGSIRQDTWHGSCPVVYGHKIVANKWIRYNSQFQTFQCSLNPNE